MVYRQRDTRNGQLAIRDDDANLFDPMVVDITQTKTEVGNYFVSNYPPFSQWKPEFVPYVLKALNEPARVDEPLGL
ncbi:MAG TPA: hypothetical protein VIR01_01685, partial [Pyrinomonadaceae bacterium]